MRGSVSLKKTWVVRLCQSLAVFAGLLGITALLGWATNALDLASVRSDWIPMAPSTAILFVLTSAVAFALFTAPRSERARRYGSVAALFGIVVAGTLLVLSISGIHAAIERAGFRAPGPLGNNVLGHMSPVTAAEFLLILTAILAAWLPWESRRWLPRTAFWLAAISSLSSFTLILGYLYGSPLLYTAKVIPPALTTIVAFSALGIALLVFTLTRDWWGVLQLDEPLEPSALILIFVFLVLATGIVVTGYLYFQSRERLFQEQAAKELRGIAQLKIEDLARWRTERLGDAQIFVHNENIALRARFVVEHPDDAVGRDRLVTWLRRVQSTYHYESAYFLDSTGRVMATVPPSAGPAGPYLASQVPVILAGGKADFIDFYRDGPEAPVYLAVAAPIADPEDQKKPLGVLVFRIDPETFLYPFIRRWPMPSDSAETLLVRRDGDDVLFLNKLRFHDSTPLTLRIPMTRTTLPAAMAIRGETGVVEGEDYRGVRVFADVAPVPDSPWFMVARVDHWEVDSPLRERLLWVINFVIILLVAAGGIIGYLLRHRQLTRHRERVRAAAALFESEEGHRMTLESIGDAVITTDAQGSINLLNPVAQTLTGWTAAEAVGRPLDEVFRILNEETGESVESPVPRVIREGLVVGLANHTVLKSRDGITRPIADSGAPIRTKTGEIVGAVLVFRDQTEERQRNLEKEMRLDLLRLINEPNDAKGLIRGLVEYFQQLTGFEAVGIRIKKGDDYPYYETVGFPSHFVKAESFLCSYDLDGQVRRDEVGKPLIDCMCGNVLCGRFDPNQFFFTQRGSFVANCTTELLAVTTQEELQGRTRNRCNGEGYESVGLFRMRCGEETIGLLQFNDKREGRFTPVLVEFLEYAADQIALALSRRLGQEELRAALTRYHNTLESMLEGCQILDSEWRYLYVNDAAARHGRRPKEDLLGRTMMECYPGIENTEMFESLRKCMMLRQPSTIMNKFEYPDGDTSWFELSIQPVPEGVFILSIDITGRRRAEERLRASDERHRLYVENAPDGLLVVDHEGRFVDANAAACRMTDYSKEEILGLSIRDIHTPDTVEQGLAIFERLKATGSADEETVFKRKDGSRFDITLKAVALPDKRYMGFFTDITQRKRLEFQFMQAQKMESVGRLAGGVAHDFNNLLTVIRGFSELAINSLAPSDPLRADITEIQSAADSASALTQQLLAFSRRQIVAPRILNLNKAVAQAEKMLRRVMGEDIDFVFAPDERAKKVLVDPVQVDQILMNLAVNSRDAMPDGGRFTIETHNVTMNEPRCKVCGEPFIGEYVLLAVSDDGPGIPPGIQQQIFEPFFTTKEKGKGTGLGLSTIHGIVMQNKGHINVYSELGAGTTFKIYFPAAESTPEAEEAPAQAARVDGHETILLVEDQDIVRKLVVRTLRSRGYHVIEAENGGAAFLMCEKGDMKIDLLLTDVVMPQMSGRELHGRLAQIYPGLKVLYMSGYTENAIAHHGILDRGIEFIQKPFRSLELLKKVRKVLDG